MKNVKKENTMKAGRAWAGCSKISSLLLIICKKIGKFQKL
ncbi:hypothetical protein STRDD11_01625 [Streptococcus sp. DD11]|nr:hypothetical protein STRDD11_01625 [Streptococcus sp. DD11]